MRRETRTASLDCQALTDALGVSPVLCVCLCAERSLSDAGLRCVVVVVGGVGARVCCILRETDTPLTAHALARDSRLETPTPTPTGHAASVSASMASGECTGIGRAYVVYSY